MKTELHLVLEFSDTKTEILYLAHPEDFDRCLDIISDGLLKTAGCTLYSGEPDFVPTEDELKESQIDLVIIPATKNLLEKDSKVKRLYEKLAPKLFPRKGLKMQSTYFRSFSKVILISKNFPILKTCFIISFG